MKEPSPTLRVSNQLGGNGEKLEELRVCLDPQPFSKAILRNPFRPPDTEGIHVTLHGKGIFIVIDQASAFWPVKPERLSIKVVLFSHTLGQDEAQAIAPLDSLCQ